jgi:hypothetical protein
MSEFFWRFRVTEFFSVQIHYMNAHAVLHFALAEIVQQRFPTGVLLQIFSDMF